MLFFRWCMVVYSRKIPLLWMILEKQSVTDNLLKKVTILSINLSVSYLHKRILYMVMLCIFIYIMLTDSLLKKVTILSINLSVSYPNKRILCMVMLYIFYIYYIELSPLWCPGIMCELLWSDPMPSAGRAPSKRGVGIQFGPDVTQKFLDHNGLDYIIRSHEVKDEGYEVLHGGKCITVFSAPNYWWETGGAMHWGSCLKTGQHFIFVIIYLLLPINCIILDSVSKILFNFFIANNNNYDSNTENIAP